MKNIELKIPLSDINQTKRCLKKIGAKKQCILQQVDTYFNTAKGRLKLREIDNIKCELIYYERPNESNSKISNYKITHIDNKNKDKVKNKLRGTCGEKVIIKKNRELWIYKHTRIHLDTVESLGKFLELETVVSSIDMSEAQSEHSSIIKELHISQCKKLSNSYSDMLLDFGLKCT